MASYVSITFVANELLTSTKMNQMAANDAGFNDGTALADGIIVTRHLAASGLTIPPNNLATNAITLGYQSITSNYTNSTNGSYQDVTGASVTVNVPAGGRSLKITAFYESVYSSAPASAGLAIREGSTVLNKSFISATATAISSTVVAYVPAPSAGSHTYKLSVENSTGTLTVQSTNSTSPGPGVPGVTFILVELI